jgi:hypothetical protein
VGEVITIDLQLMLPHLLYEQLSKQLDSIPGVVVDGTEDPLRASKDVGSLLRNLNFDSSFVNYGLLKKVSFDKQRGMICLSGDVIFTTEGHMRFREPLSNLFTQRNVQLTDLTVAPRYVRDQIETNKLVELLTFITVATGFLSLGIGLRAGRI